MPIIVVEGPDHAGKTTLARALKQQLDPLFSEVEIAKSPVKEHGWSDQYNTYLRDRTRLLQNMVGIQDRTPEISEAVYGTMRGEPRGRGWAYETYGWLDLDIFFVFCQNPDYVLRGSHRDAEGNVLRDQDLHQMQLLYDHIFFQLSQLVIHAHPHSMRITDYSFTRFAWRRVFNEIGSWLVWQFPEKHRDIHEALVELDTFPKVGSDESI